MKNFKNSKKKFFLLFFWKLCLGMQRICMSHTFFVYNHEAKTWDKFLVMILGVYFWSEMKNFKNSKKNFFFNFFEKFLFSLFLIFGLFSVYKSYQIFQISPFLKKSTHWTVRKIKNEKKNIFKKIKKKF